MIYEQSTLNGSYVLRNLFVMKYEPRKQHLNVQQRRQSTLLYIREGRYHYHWAEGDVYAGAGDMVYVPQNASYAYFILSEKTEAIQVEFTLEKDGQPALFSPGPAAVTPASSGRAEQLFEEMLVRFYENDFAALSSLYAVLALFVDEYQQTKRSADGQKIKPAVNHIRRCYMKKIYVSELADLCGMSEAQLRRLFQKHLGRSPIQYKNHLLAQTAASMLRTQSVTVSEVAAALQFPDLYTFSQMFKKEMGLSPRQYMQLGRQ